MHIRLMTPTTTEIKKGDPDFGLLIMRQDNNLRLQGIISTNATNLALFILIKPLLQFPFNHSPFWCELLFVHNPYILKLSQQNVKKKKKPKATPSQSETRR